MNESTRPRHVVVVDADNPLREIHGEFFWREDHEAIVEAERETAYRRGYEAGMTDGLSRPVQVVVRRGRGRSRSLLARALVAFVALAFLVDLAGNLIH